MNVSLRAFFYSLRHQMELTSAPNINIPAGAELFIDTYHGPG